MANPNIVIKKVLETNLPSTGIDGEFYYTNQGNVYCVQKSDLKLKKITDLMTGYTNLTDLQTKNPAISNKLYLTNDGKLYYYRTSDTSYQPLGGIGDMTKSIYDTNNDGIVDKASNIDGVFNANPLTYYGKDSAGNVGFHNFPIGTTDGVNQAVKLNVLANIPYTIDLSSPNSNNDLIIQCYKFVAGINNTVQILKTFDNADSTNFYYDNNNITFDGNIKIKDSYNYNGTIINISDFINIGDFVV